MLRIIFILSFFLISCKSIENNNEVDYYNEIQTKGFN